MDDLSLSVCQSLSISAQHNRTPKRSRQFTVLAKTFVAILGPHFDQPFFVAVFFRSGPTSDPFKLGRTAIVAVRTPGTRPKPKTRSLGYLCVQLIPERETAPFRPVRRQSEPVVKRPTIPNELQKGAQGYIKRGPTKYQRKGEDARHLSMRLFRLVLFRYNNDQNKSIDRTRPP
jgi:hypothetical protein